MGSVARRAGLLGSGDIVCLLEQVDGFVVVGMATLALLQLDTQTAVRFKKIQMRIFRPRLFSPTPHHVQTIVRCMTIMMMTNKMVPWEHSSVLSLLKTSVYLPTAPQHKERHRNGSYPGFADKAP